VARLFVAVQPPDEVLDRIESLPRADAPGVRWTRRGHWHVTVRFLGDAEIAEAVAAVAVLDAPIAEARVGPAVSRLGRNVVCLPVAGLDGLARAVATATAAVGEPPDPRPFAGHLTLARLRHRAACGLAGTRFEATFPVASVDLVESTLTAEGPVYRVITERALRGAP